MRRKNKSQPVIARSIGAVFVSLFLSFNSSAAVINRIAAVVNSAVITENELNRVIATKGKNLTGIKAELMRQEALTGMIDDILFKQLMEKVKIEVTDDDLSKAIANVLYRSRISLDELRRELAAKGMSYEEYKDQMKNDIRRVKFVNQVIGPQVRISDQDLRDYYQQNQEKFRGSISAHIAEIVLPLEGVASQAEFDALGETAVAIVSKARHGADFAALAKQHSKGPNADRGGDMGEVNLKNTLMEIAEAVKRMKTGDVSNPILSEKSIIIVKVISLPEISAKDFDKLRDDIYADMYDKKIEEAFANYLAKEKQRAFIEIR